MYGVASCWSDAFIADVALGRAGRVPTQDQGNNQTGQFLINVTWRATLISEQPMLAPADLT